MTVGRYSKGFGRGIKIVPVTLALILRRLLFVDDA